MTTTSYLQKKPDYYLSEEECIRDGKVKVQTNPRYKGYNQVQFTAGDEEQFQQYRDPTNGQVCIPSIPLDRNIFSETDVLNVWEGYENIKTPDVLNTFRYIFNKFKKGIFVKIKDNQLRVFLPFSKNAFKNEWGDQIKVDPRYRNLHDFLEGVSRAQGYNYNPKYTQEDMSKWYGNNCILRYENPLSEGDSNVTNVKNMLETLCQHRRVPDIELFFNRRDFPLLTRDGTEPYDGLWGSDSKKLVSHSYERYLPILSMSRTDKYADVLTPTWDDWARVQNLTNNIWFPKTCKNYNDEFDTPWHAKIPTAIFRGGSTGCGVDTRTNMRLKVAKMSADMPKKPGIPLLDAGITNWNLRPRKNRDSKYLQTIHPDKLGIKLVNKLSSQEQSKYKYVIHIQGHVSAFRLSMELAMRSVILYVENQWKIWYSDMLIPYTHYVPVKKDLSNLIEQIQWCKEHDKECEQIARNARKFYDTYLQFDGILDYMQKIIVQLKDKMGVYLYNTITPLDAMIYKMEINLDRWHPNTGKTILDINRIPSVGRSYGLLEGVRYMVNMLGDYFPERAVYKGELFRNKLGSIYRYDLAGFSFVVKSTRDRVKMSEHIHEAYIGINAINKLAKHIPNFAYVFGKFYKNDTVNVIMERIYGETMDEYIKSQRFNMRDYMNILAQICLALHVAQKECGLVHWDLKPWNIIIQKLPNPVSFDYAISHKLVYRIKTDIIPVIIDYGKSHVVVDNVHHGYVNPYAFSTIQDVLTLLLTTVHQILSEKRLQDNELDIIMSISNFITNTRYRKKKFDNANHIKAFFSDAKKYTALTHEDKHDLEKKTPLDFLNYVATVTKYKLPITSATTYIPLMDKENPKQVFDYILSSSQRDKILSYEDVFSTLKQSTIPQPNCKLFAYYSIQQLESNLTSVWLSFERYLKAQNMSTEYHQNLFENTISFLEKVYDKKLKTDKQTLITYEDSKKLTTPKYTEETFLVPSDIKGMMKKFKSVYSPVDLLYVFLYNGKHKLADSDREYYIKLLEPVLKICCVNDSVNNKTLHLLSKLVYEDSKNTLEKLLENQVGNCEEAEKILSNYTEIEILNKKILS